MALDNFMRYGDLVLFAIHRVEVKVGLHGVHFLGDEILFFVHFGSGAFGDGEGGRGGGYNRLFELGG